jgi:hypothetical protein
MDSSYLDKEGNCVFTSYYLKARKTCCKTACLHCPYGFTIKKNGIQFQDFTLDRCDEANEILAEHKKMLSDIQGHDHANIKFMILKGHVMGMLIKNHIIIKEFYLKKYFQDQDIYKELVESYLF